jgi:chemotaxis protein CheY-P-specific phosphatase CheC
MRFLLARDFNIQIGTFPAIYPKYVIVLTLLFHRAKTKVHRVRSKTHLKRPENRIYGQLLARRSGKSKQLTDMNQEMKERFEPVLRDAFEAGYLNAALSLSRLTGGGISFNNFRFSNHKLYEGPFDTHVRDGRAGTDLMLTTEVFGDLSGKSYLLLSVDELEWITSKIPGHANQHENMTEEFIKEVNNILSASVITWLSNHLERRVYGNVPVLAGKLTRRMEDVIHEDFRGCSEEVFVNSVSFSIENHPEVHPTFVWVIDTRLMHKPEPKTTH